MVIPTSTNTLGGKNQLAVRQLLPSFLRMNRAANNVEPLRHGLKLALERQFLQRQYDRRLTLHPAWVR